MIQVSRKEKQLKEDSRHQTGIESIIKKLDDEGIFQRKQRGRIISLYREKGFGFIRSMGVNYYLKLPKLSNADQLSIDDNVTFTIKRGGDRVDKILNINRTGV